MSTTGNRQQPIGNSTQCPPTPKLVVQKSIMKLLEMNEQEYANLVFDQGMEYLRHYTRNDECAVQQLSYSKSYWAWWKNICHQIDELFLAKYIVHGNRFTKLLRKRWNIEHGQDYIRSYPDITIMNDGYVFDNAVKEVSSN